MNGGVNSDDRSLRIIVRQQQPFHPSRALAKQSCWRAPAKESVP